MNLDELLKDLDWRSTSIPFGNSDFQNSHFVVGTQDGQARQYRAALLRAQDRRRALEEEKYRRAIEDIDIEEIQEALSSGVLSKFEKRRKELELEKKLNDRRHSDKLIGDAIHELHTLYQIISAHPSYTREEFESLEAQHYLSNLGRQIEGKTGAAESLLAMQREDVLGVGPAWSVALTSPSSDVLSDSKKFSSET